MRISLLLLLPAIVVARDATHLAARPPRIATISGHDYAFVVPEKLPAGPTTFRFVNKGKFRHEMLINLLKPGTSVDSFVAYKHDGRPTGVFIDRTVGVLFADPGKTDAAGLTTNLLPGRDYIVVCGTRNDSTAMRHEAMGMVSVIHVLPGATVPDEDAPVDTIV